MTQLTVFANSQQIIQKKHVKTPVPVKQTKQLNVNLLDQMIIRL